MPGIPIGPGMPIWPPGRGGGIAAPTGPPPPKGASRYRDQDRHHGWHTQICPAVTYTTILASHSLPRKSTTAIFTMKNKLMHYDTAIAPAAIEGPAPIGPGMGGLTIPPGGKPPPPEGIPPIGPGCCCCIPPGAGKPTGRMPPPGPMGMPPGPIGMPPGPIGMPGAPPWGPVPCESSDAKDCAMHPVRSEGMTAPYHQQASGFRTRAAPGRMGAPDCPPAGKFGMFPALFAGAHARESPTSRSCGRDLVERTCGLLHHDARLLRHYSGSSLHWRPETTCDRDPRKAQISISNCWRDLVYMSQPSSFHTR